MVENKTLCKLFVLKILHEIMKNMSNKIITERKVYL